MPHDPRSTAASAAGRPGTVPAPARAADDASALDRFEDDGAAGVDERAARRPLRADAERNRRKIMAAAREVFAERGLVSLDEVAAHAGVGVGTVYRRFASRDELVDALFTESMDELVGLARNALARSEDMGAFAALRGFLTSYLELHASDRALSSVVLTDVHGRGKLDRGKAEMKPIAAELLRRAKAEGTVRADLESTDLPAALIMLISLINASRDTQPELWRRYLAVVLDGFASTSRTPLGDTAPLPPDLVPPTMHAAFGGGC